MLNTLFFGRMDILVLGPLISDVAPSSEAAPKQDSTSSWRSFGVSGGDGGSDLKTGGSELVDQTAVWASNSLISSIGIGGGGGIFGVEVRGASIRLRGLGFGMGNSCGTGRPEARRRYWSARAVTQLIRMDSDARKTSLRLMKRGLLEPKASRRLATQTSSSARFLVRQRRHSSINGR